MFAICILKNLWNSLFSIEPTGQEIFGFSAEKVLQNLLNEKQYVSFFNRILKNPYNKHLFLEIDAIVYYKNTIFCIEIKNYKGTIYYAANSKDGTFESYKDNKIIQLKTDIHLRQTYKELPNPFNKTKFFTKQLKEYLRKLDKRFSKVKFQSVVVWVDSSTNIENIHSFDDGIIYLSQLCDFIEQKSASGENDSVIVKILENLPSFDKIITTHNYTISGILMDNTILLKESNTQLHLQNIKSITIVHKLTSCNHTLTVEYTDCHTINYACKQLTINLDKFGTHQKHKISNVKKIIVGTHSLRPFEI